MTTIKPQCQLDSGNMVCSVCGYRASKLPTFRDCAPPPPPPPWKPVDVGALVERGLTAVGITKERVERITRTAGKPGGCGCEGRKKWLTEAGNSVQYAARDAVQAAQKFYFGQ
jgi:hypothetical protein